MIKVHGWDSVLMVPVEFSLRIKLQFHFNPLYSIKESNKCQPKSYKKKQVACQLDKNRAARSMSVKKEIELIVSY